MEDRACRGVEAYLLNGDAFGTILLDIEEVDALTLYKDWAKEMQDAFHRADVVRRGLQAIRAQLSFCPALECAAIKSPVQLGCTVWCGRASSRFEQSML